MVTIALHILETDEHIGIQFLSRKSMQTANLDERKPMPFLNDTLLLNSVLLEAGITSAGYRLEVLMTLKTMERARREVNLHMMGSPRQGGVVHFGGVPGVPVQLPQIVSPIPTAKAQLVQFHGPR